MDDQQRRLTAKRIKQLRDDFDWTQGELANRLGVKKQTISGFETGRSGISRIADRLAQVLGTTTDYLYGLTDNPLPPNDEEEDDERPPVNAARDAILAEYDRLDELNQRALHEMAVTLRLTQERRKTTQRVIE